MPTAILFCFFCLYFDSGFRVPRRGATRNGGDAVPQSAEQKDGEHHKPEKDAATDAKEGATALGEEDGRGAGVCTGEWHRAGWTGGSYTDIFLLRRAGLVVVESFRGWPGSRVEEPGAAGLGNRAYCIGIVADAAVMRSAQNFECAWNTAFGGSEWGTAVISTLTPPNPSPFMRTLKKHLNRGSAFSLPELRLPFLMASRNSSTYYTVRSGNRLGLFHPGSFLQLLTRRPLENSKRMGNANWKDFLIRCPHCWMRVRVITRSTTGQQVPLKMTPPFPMHKSHTSRVITPSPSRSLAYIP